MDVFIAECKLFVPFSRVDRRYRAGAEPLSALTINESEQLGGRPTGTGAVRGGVADLHWRNAWVNEGTAQPLDFRVTKALVHQRLEPQIGLSQNEVLIWNGLFLDKSDVGFLQ